MPMQGQIEVTVEDGRLTRLLINNRWQGSGGPAELGEAISQAIRDAIGAASEPGLIHATRPVLREMTPRERREHMAMHRDYMRRSLEFSRRVVRGEFVGEPLGLEVEEGTNVAVRFRDGWFSELILNPQWAQQATANSIMDAVLAACDGIALTPESPAVEELRALHRERARIREFARGGEERP